jgi:ketosteroid isomerase-like protein
MKSRSLVLSLIILLVFVIGCPRGGEADEVSKASVEADIAAIKALFQEFVPLYNSHDYDKIVSVFYAEDSIQMPPNEPVRMGKEAIRLGYRRTAELNDEHCDRSVIEDLRVSGDLAVVRGADAGTSIPRGGGEPVKYNLKWLTVLRRQPDGAWKWICEMWNYDDAL